jgi:predicted ATPase/DNA-binding CsgD family transcriptional regulator
MFYPALPRFHCLPVQRTSCLGRESEVAELRARLRDSEVRLLTLTGPGGIGKTRLALEAGAALVDHFPHGVAFVDLAPVRDAARVPAAIAQALDVRETGAGSALDALVVELQDKALLLVLDNLEQVLAAAPALAELLAACPGVTLLVTSRAPLRLRWEQEVPVAPLALPDPHLAADMKALADVSAVALFIQRARAVRPGFALTPDNAGDVAAISTHLQGMPLAIELAAARVRLLSPRALRARLAEGTGATTLQLLSGGARDLPKRQRSLRATIAWSHDLLSAMERTLFRRLAVFTGGCTLEAAEAVCGEAPEEAMPGTLSAPSEPPASGVLEGLASLVEKSLLVQHEGPDGEPRFGMLETIHEFGREQLAGSGEEEVLRRRHADYLLQFARTAGRALAGPAQGEWVRRLERDYHNLRAALAWALTAGEGEQALRLCAALHTFWYNKGHYREGRDWCARALAAASQAPPATRATVLRGAASLADIQHAYVEARSLIEASVALYRTGDDRGGLARSLALLGMIARHERDWATARQACEEALAIYAEAPEPWGQRLALGVLGWVAEDQGDRTTARRLLAASLAVAREGKSPIDVALQLNNLGIVAIRDGDDVEAELRHREALRLTSEVGAHEPLACALEGLAAVAAARRDPRRAAGLLGAAAGLRAEIGAPRIAQFEEEHRRVVPLVRQALGEEAFETAAARGAAVPIAEVAAAALAGASVADTPPVVTAGGGTPRELPRRASPANLTPRQIAYLRLLAGGATNKAIAAELVVSEAAVEQMLVRLYEKIHVRNRAEMIRFAYEHGLLDAPAP